MPFGNSTLTENEVLFEAARPIILNGIEDIITRPDLADRAMFLTLPHVREERRRSEKEIWRDFELVRPQILGALMEAVAHGLRALPKVRLAQLPRMADFAIWSTACEAAFCPAGGFSAAYDSNRRAAVEQVVEADPVAARIREMMAERSIWIGNASDLMRASTDFSANGTARNRVGWPNSPRALAGRLRRAQTPLRALGIEITFSREGRSGMRTIRLSTSRRAQSDRPSEASVPSAESAPSWRNAGGADGTDAAGRKLSGHSGALSRNWAQDGGCAC